MPNAQAEINVFILNLKRRKIEGSLECAKQTATLLRHYVSMSKGKSTESVIANIKSLGRQLMGVKPLEMATGNIVRRVLYMVREEMNAAQGGGAEWGSVDFDQEGGRHMDGGLEQALSPLMEERRSALSKRTLSLHNLLEMGPAPPHHEYHPHDDYEVEEGATSPDDQRSVGGSTIAASTIAGSEMGGGGGRRAGSGRPVPFSRVKAAVIESLNELIEELDEINNNIAEQAMEHIHAREVILTFAASKTVENFLLAAASKRNFQVVASEGAPAYLGQGMARKLAESGIHTTCITDSAIFAMMARVNKVIVGCHAVLANGGVIAPVGMHMVALAAAKHAVPFVVLTGLHKLTPVFPHDPNVSMNEFKSPSQVLQMEDVVDCLYQDGGGDKGEPNPDLLVMNPGFDYIPPHLVALFITDTGGHNPSYVYRLLAEYYSPMDYDLSSDATF